MPLSGALGYVLIEMALWQDMPGASYPGPGRFYNSAPLMQTETFSDRDAPDNRCIASGLRESPHFSKVISS